MGEPLASLLAEDGLDEAVAALCTVALVDREIIVGERDPDVTSDTIRLHRLVREVATTRLPTDARDCARRALLVAALAASYLANVFNHPQKWPRARRLDTLALALVGGDAGVPEGAEKQASRLLNRLAAYRYRALAAYTQARPLFERALAIHETTLGPRSPDHPDTAASLNNLAHLLQAQGDLAGARQLYSTSAR